MIEVTYNGPYGVESYNTKADRFEILGGVLLVYNQYDRVIAAFTKWLRVWHI